MNSEQRIEPREVVGLPLTLADGRLGFMRDISASGAYFETDVRHKSGSDVEFTVKFDMPEGSMRLRCRGHVVRIELHGERMGSAVKLTDSKFEAMT